jgi:hypothetical protein
MALFAGEIQKAVGTEAGMIDALETIQRLTATNFRVSEELLAAFAAKDEKRP